MLLFDYLDTLPTLYRYSKRRRVRLVLSELVLARMQMYQVHVTGIPLSAPRLVISNYVTMNNQDNRYTIHITLLFAKVLIVTIIEIHIL